jgi:hypothetical protein
LRKKEEGGRKLAFVQNSSKEDETHLHIHESDSVGSLTRLIHFHRFLPIFRSGKVDTLALEELDEDVAAKKRYVS